MATDRENHREMAPWRLYTTITCQSLVLFYLATFLVALYFSTSGFHSIPSIIILVLTYFCMIGFILYRIVKRFSVAALMLIVPIAPLIALIFVVTMIPILEWLC